MSVEYGISGLTELQQLLDSLPANIEKKLMRGALRAGVKVIMNDAKGNLAGHHETGQLQDSLRISTKARRGRVTAVLKAGNQNAYYAHMVEFGTAPHLISAAESDMPTRTNRHGTKPISMKTLNRMIARGSLKIGSQFVGPIIQHPGAQKIPFMRRALDRNMVDNGPAFDAIKRYLAGRIDKELAKLPDESDGETR